MLPSPEHRRAADRARAEEERRARERAEADAMMEAFAALEDRADMDPWLADDPIARLGYREIGGLRGTDYLPLSNNAHYFTSGYSIPQLDREIRRDIAYDIGMPILESIGLMDPDRREAFEYGREEYLIPPRTIGISPTHASEPTKAHEARHGGVHVIEDMLMDSPELRSRVLQATRLRPTLFPLSLEFEERPTFPLRRGFEEGIVELGDDLTDTWVLPSGEHRSMHSTVQYLPGRGEPGRNVLSDLDFARAQLYEQVMREIAQEELTRRGEPPRAVMREPEPGNIFYREPEPREGLLGLFDRLRGN